ncbi:jmjC domain containing protein [Ditylenchus destructor]|uniref:JmjC domain containing protein n=1 Tax=Ditylenchus destructor TaxID=166010 RepID=A0AAD4R303_9BILA|nr:jmjC domain containing protein [Ditylenchus destructor]
MSFISFHLLSFRGQPIDISEHRQNGIMNSRYDSGTLVVPICWFFVIERKSAGTLMVVQRKSKLLVYWPDWCSLFVPKDVLRLCDLSVHPVSKNGFTRAESNLHRRAGAFGIGHGHGDCDIPILVFTQKAGDIVWVGGRCVHWVQSTG